MDFMTTPHFVEPGTPSIPLTLIESGKFPEWLSNQASFTQQWLTSVGFNGAADTYWLIPDEQGQLSHAVMGVKSLNDFWSAGNCARMLPARVYELQGLTPQQAFNACCAWGLGAYQFTKYKTVNKKTRAQLVWPEFVDRTAVQSVITATYLVRDLVNTPTEDMTPHDLSAACRLAVEPHAAQVKIIEGSQLLEQNYPAIHTVGRASTNTPCLIDIRWGDAQHPRLTLVGKGVCFDSGGLDIKSASNMGLMKKDMGGAAHAIGLAVMIMQAKLPVRLRVLIPAVENVIAGNAYRPGDVIKMRKGLTVEVTNTDAEGRLVLADALTEAASEQPSLLIDFATLTGAARVALGTDVPIFFTPQDELAAELSAAGKKAHDPVWQLPLYEGYKKMLESPIADLNNCPASSYGGAITAALFLQEFVPSQIQWIHFDLMAWNLSSRPGRPEGGEAMGLRTVWEYIKNKYIN